MTTTTSTSSRSTSFECSICGEIISVARKDQHEKYWCRETAIINISPDEKVKGLLPDEDEEQNEDDEKQPIRNIRIAPIAVQVQAQAQARDLQDLNTQVHKITTIEFKSIIPAGSNQNLEFSFEFEEISVFASNTSTGGALWKSELLLAEWILRELSGTISTPITEDQPVVVVELGCGACPAAGMVAAAMGAITIMTDRTEVVKLAEVNIRRNIHTISKIATRKNNTGKKLQQQQQQQTTTIPLPPSSPKPLVKLLGRNSIDTAVYEWGDATTIPDRISSLAAIDVILIGDCIFSNTTHKKLLQSIARLHLIPFKYQNQYNHPKIIMAYQQRTNGTEVMDFFRMANKDFGFRTIPIENASELKNKLDGSTVGLEICQLVSS